ncbi:MAG TPA: hypothetical protein PLH94_07085 [Fimbriimonadaceae bacterium]|nr:hypothetical protein [Fimbriimonadaceae bacterium]
MAESLALVEGAYFQPAQIRVCKPLLYAGYACNYGGPLRKPAQIKDNASYQHVARVLVDCCFQIEGDCRKIAAHSDYDPARKLQEMLKRRLEEGKSRFPVCLGWKEFAPTYFGPWREGTVPDPMINESVPGYLLEVWDRPAHGSWAPKFADVQIVEGVCDLREVLGHAR